MPARSERQRRYLFAKFGEAWVRRHHFDRLADDAKARKGGRTLRAAAKGQRAHK
jgi:hypothetical protein